jgi:hypothetical protein
MSPSPIPPLEDDDPQAPTSYFQLEQRRAGETKLGGEALTTPLPVSSPWGSAGMAAVPDEEPIDRSEDSDSFGSAINEHDGTDDADHFTPIVGDEYGQD